MSDVVFTPAALLDQHERVHRSLRGLLDHCRGLDADELDREHDGFGPPSVRLQLHHVMGAERYWSGVLEGRIDVQEDEADYPTIDRLEELRTTVAGVTRGFLERSTPGELGAVRTYDTWDGRRQDLAPARVILRIQTHAFHHQGQVLAMCRLMGKPGGLLDYPLD